MQSRYALLVIDMQLVAFDGKITPPIMNGPQLLESIANLIALSRSGNIPIVFVQTCAAPGQPYANDAHGWEIHPSITVRPEDRIVFKRNSCGFDDTTLQQDLVKLGVEGVITCGIWSEFCVTNTSISALKLGFDVFVAANAHGTVSASQQEAAGVISRQNDYLKRNNATVTDVEGLREALELD